MKNQKTSHLVRIITFSAVIAALYTVLTLIFAPISFGNIQCRISEALVILPIFTPVSIIGLTLGCFLSNLIGLLSGVNPLGIPDMLFGTAATLLAAVSTYLLRNFKIKSFPLFSFFPPLIFNGLIIGLELNLILQLPFILSAIEVLTGEFISVFVLGIPLYFILNKKSINSTLFNQI